MKNTFLFALGVSCVLSACSQKAGGLSKSGTPHSHHPSSRDSHQNPNHRYQHNAPPIPE